MQQSEKDIQFDQESCRTQLSPHLIGQHNLGVHAFAIVCQ